MLFRNYFKIKLNKKRIKFRLIERKFINQKLHSQIPLAVPIAGIRHIDFKSHPIEVQFKEGGIGYHTTTIQLTSQKGHGINSTFIFYAN